MSYDMFYKSIIEQDKCSMVICNLEHEIIYMNPAAAEHYAGRGGKNLIGKNLLDCHNAESKEKILRVVEWFAKPPITILSILTITIRRIKMYI